MWVSLYCKIYTNFTVKYHVTANFLLIVSNSTINPLIPSVRKWHSLAKKNYFNLIKKGS